MDLRLDPELGRVKADPIHIDQLIMNLVVNARDAIAGGGRLTIETRNERVAVPMEGAPHPNPFLTTVDWPREELGRVAAEFLMTAIRNSVGRDPMTKTFSPRLLERLSTAPPAA